MKQYITIDKRSKKAQKEYYSKQRRTWEEVNPITRVIPSAKTYNRKKEKRKVGMELRYRFNTDFCLNFVV